MSLSGIMKPLTVILGATGTGKSKLAIDLARRFNGEIISADSMQVYQGLDIVTNKVSQMERSLCPHYMIDIVSPLRANFTVTEFKNMSLKIMEDIWSREKLPIIVGGTNYYIESLLWDFVLQSGTCATSQDETSDEEQESKNFDDLVLPSFDRDKSVATSELYETLKKIDPGSAKNIHPNDRRKILRALQVFRQTGQTLTQLLENQHGKTSADSTAVSGKLRFPNARMIWLKCEQSVLDERLNQRVDEMISRGLVAELINFHDRYKVLEDSNGWCRDYTLGIFQTIGFKEFHKFIMLTDEERMTEDGSHLLQQGIEEMKRATRKYARRQIKWIVSRFQKRREAEVPPVYVVDATYQAEWEAKVLGPASEVVNCLLQNKVPALKPQKREEGYDNRVYRECKDCNVTAISRINWEAHVNGRRHKKRVDSRRRVDRDLINTLTVYCQHVKSTRIHHSGVPEDQPSGVNNCSNEDVNELGHTNLSPGN